MTTYVMIYLGLGLALTCLSALAAGYIDDLDVDAMDAVPMSLTATVLILFWPLAILGLIAFSMVKLGQRLRSAK